MQLHAPEFLLKLAMVSPVCNDILRTCRGISSVGEVLALGRQQSDVQRLAKYRVRLYFDRSKLAEWTV